MKKNNHILLFAQIWIPDIFKLGWILTPLILPLIASKRYFRFICSVLSPLASPTSRLKIHLQMQVPHPTWLTYHTLSHNQPNQIHTSNHNLTNTNAWPTNQLKVQQTWLTNWPYIFFFIFFVWSYTVTLLDKKKKGSILVIIGDLLLLVIW